MILQYVFPVYLTGVLITAILILKTWDTVAEETVLENALLRKRQLYALIIGTIWPMLLIIGFVILLRQIAFEVLIFAASTLRKLSTVLLNLAAFTGGINQDEEGRAE